MGQLNTQQNVKETSNTNSTYRENIENTPFTIIKENESGYFAVMGMYILTEKYEKKEELIEQVTRITWNRIVQIIQILNEMNK